jgi:hypothetical protein
MQSNDEEMVKSLLATANDETKPAEERYAALRHACQLRGDVYQAVPIEQLRFVAAGMQSFCGLTPLSLKDAAEAVASGFQRKERAESSRKGTP